MKQILLFLLMICSSMCHAQEFTVSINQEKYGKVAILDQKLKPNDETTLYLSYVPKVGDIEFPTIIWSFPELFEVIVGKNVLGYIESIYIDVETSEGVLHYYSSLNEGSLNLDATNVVITMFLAKVHLEKNKYQIAKGTNAWAKKIKNVLTRCVVHKITMKTSVIYSNGPNELLPSRSKDFKHTINFSPNINLASLFNMLFKTGDATSSLHH